MGNPTLAGQVVSFFVLTLLVTAILAPLVLWRYASAVLAGMQQRGGGALPLPRPLPLPPSPPPAAAALQGGADADRLAWQGRAERRVLLAWFTAFGVCGLLLALVARHADAEPFVAAQVLAQTSLYAMVALPVVAVSLGWTWRQALARAWLALAVGAVLTTAVSVLARLLSGRAPSLDQLMNLPLYFVAAAAVLWAPLLMLAASGTARVRGVVPALFAGLVVFGAAPFLGLHSVLLLADTGAGGQAMLAQPLLGSRHLWFVLLALPFSGLMVWRLRALATAYARKRFSDVQLLAQSWWLMFCVQFALGLLATQGGRVAGALACVAVAAVLAPATRLGMALAEPSHGAPPARTLLVLRVFGWRRRTEQLLDRIASRWRYQGPVTMIAAPDVTARTIDPVDFLAWLLGRSGDSFVRTADELQQRLASIDQARDPDGRHRINEFCCTESTWRATVVELMHRADVVLMDLRGLQGQHAGCAFELQQLAQRLDPARVVLVVAPGADRGPVLALLGAAAGRVVFHELPDRMGVDAADLFNTLLRAVQAGTPQHPAGHQPPPCQAWPAARETTD